MADNRGGGDVYTDYLFTGQKQDDTGLLYCRARYYDKLLVRRHLARPAHPRPGERVRLQPVRLLPRQSPELP